MLNVPAMESMVWSCSRIIICCSSMAHAAWWSSLAPWSRSDKGYEVLSMKRLDGEAGPLPAFEPTREFGREYCRV